MKFLTRFNSLAYDGTFNNLPSMTEQCHKDDCDINVLYHRFVKEMGIDERHQDLLEVLNQVKFDLNTQPIDYSDMTIQNGYALSEEIRRAFYKLSPDVRVKFDNDYKKFHARMLKLTPEDVLAMQKGAESAAQGKQPVQPKVVQENGEPNPQA